MKSKVLALILLLGIASIFVHRGRSGLAQQFPAPQNISQTSARSFDPAIAADSNGNINVVWAEGGFVVFRRSTDRGTNFSRLFASLLFGSTSNPDIAVFGTLNVFVVWEGVQTGKSGPAQGALPGIYFARSSNGGASFTQTTSPLSARGTSPAITTDSSGNIYVVWVDRTQMVPIIKLRRSTNAGASFSDAIPVSLIDVRVDAPDIAADSAGNIYVVWQAEVNNSPVIRLARSTNQGQSFPDVRTIPADFGMPREPAIAVDSNRTINVVWAETRASSTGIVFTRSTNQGVNFSQARPAISVVSGSQVAAHPDIALDAAGNINVVGQVAASSGDLVRPADIFFTRSINAGASFSSAVNLSINLGFSVSPAIAAEPSGNVDVVWQDSTSGNDEIFFVRGTAAPPAVPGISVSPMAVDFGGVTIGQSADRTITVTSTGTAPLTVSSITSDIPEFTLVSAASFAVPAGSSQQVTLRFRPTAAGTRSGMLTINSNDPVRATVTVPLTGQGVAPAAPSIVVEPAALNFGNVNVSSSADLTLNVRNTGDAALNVTRISSNNAQFSVVAPSGTFSVAANSQQAVMVRFRPTSVSTETGTLTLISNDPIRTTVTVPLQGQGVTPAAPNIVVEPTVLNFGNVNVNSSADLTLTVRNTGNALLNVTSITSNNPRFGVITPSGSFNVAANSQQAVTVRFRPTSVGTETGMLTIISNDPIRTTVTVPLQGQGVSPAAPNIVVEPTALNFGDVNVSSSADLTLTVRNTGNALLNVTSITSSNPRFGVIAPSVPFSVGANVQQAVTVRFRPTSVGTESGMLTINSNDPARAIVTVPLRGQGLAAAPDLVVSGLTVSPTNASPGGAVTVRFAIINQGIAPAGSATHEVRLSSDTEITTADPLLRTVPTPTLDIGSSSPFSETITIPSRTAAGVMFIGVTADSLNSVTESNENNNTVVTPITITTQPQFAVLTVFPANGAVNTPLVSNIEVSFSAPVAPGTVTAGTLMVSTSAGAVSGRVVAANNRAFFFPSDRLSPQTSFRVRVVGGPSGVRGLVGGIQVPLAAEFLSSFTTESQAARMQPPTDGDQPVRVEVGGTVTDGAGTGAAVTVPSYTLKTDTVVNIIVLDAQQRLSEINNNCDVRIDSTSVFLPLPSSLRVSELVRYQSQPCGAVAFSPGMDLTFPLRSAFRGGFTLGTPLRVFQLVEIGNRLTFLDTGIDAQVTRPGTVGFGDFAIASGVEVFGTYALFVRLNDLPGNLRQIGLRSLMAEGTRPWEEFDPKEAPTVAPGAGVWAKTGSDSRQSITLQSAGSNTTTTLYFPVITQTDGRATRLSLANPGPTVDLNVQFTAYGDTGSNLGVQSKILLSGQQASFLVSDLFPSLTSGAIIVQAQNGRITGFYEIADNFTNPGMLDGAEAVVSSLTALVFPLIRTTGGAFTEIRVFNPNESAVDVRLAIYNAAGNRIGLATEKFTLQPKEQLVRSSTGTASGSPSLVIPFDQAEGGSIVFESVTGDGLMGVELEGETLVVSGTTQRNLAVMNAVGRPSGCRQTGAGGCQIDPMAPPASRQRSAYAVPLEGDPATAEVTVANVSDSDALVALSAFRSDGSFGASFPTTGFFTLRAHEVFKAPIANVFDFNPGPNGYIRVEDLDSVVVGAIINRDVAGQKFLTAVPLVPDLPQEGSEVTEAFFSGMRIESGAPGAQTGVFILNPNANSVQFKITVTDPTGNPVAEPQQYTLVGRGAFIRARQSLSILFPAATNGYFKIEVEQDPTPGTSGRLIPYATYYSTEYLSAVPQQRRKQ